MLVKSMLCVTLLALVSAAPPGATAQQTRDTRTADASEAASRKAVLVTGASSGIGRATAELLARRGFFVYAGARKAEDLAALDAIPNIKAVRLDVTRQSEIDAAAALIEAEGRGLFGLVNNAGVVVAAPLIEVTDDDLLFQFDVNVLGPCRVTRAMAPMIIESKGRISTTGSISGIGTWGMGGPYTMSKHAIEAFTDVLAAELSPFGVQVSVVEPGNYRSKIMSSMQQRMKERGYSATDSAYEQQMTRMLTMPTDRNQHKDPIEVAEAFLHALSDPAPKRRYLVVPNGREAEYTIRSAMRRLVELNRDQPHEFTRDQLIAMLDAELAAAPASP